MQPRNVYCNLVDSNHQMSEGDAPIANVLLADLTILVDENALGSLGKL